MNVLPELQAPKSGAWSCTEQETKPYSYTCFLPADLPWVAHHPLYTDSQRSWWEGTSAGFQSSLLCGAGKAQGIKVGQQEGYLKHKILWVNKAGCHRGCPCLFMWAHLQAGKL